jgi:hypothetical protein
VEAMANARAEVFQGATQVNTAPVHSHPSTNQASNRPSIGPNGTGYLPAASRKNLLAQIAQLAPSALPEPRDLASYWIDVEAAVEAIDSQVTLHMLTPGDL